VYRLSTANTNVQNARKRIRGLLWIGGNMARMLRYLCPACGNTFLIYEGEASYCPFCYNRNTRYMGRTLSRRPRKKQLTGKNAMQKKLSVEEVA